MKDTQFQASVGKHTYGKSERENMRKTWGTQEKRELNGEPEPRVGEMFVDKLLED